MDLPHSYYAWIAAAVAALVVVFGVVAWALSRRAGASIARADLREKKTPLDEGARGAAALAREQARGALLEPPVGDRPVAWTDGLARTRGGFVARIAGLLGRKEIDPSLLGELEEVLLTADIGMRTAQKLFEAVKARLDRAELRDGPSVWAAIKEESKRLLVVDRPRLDVAGRKPFVILTIGVNGAGKTTTIGKLAARFKGEGRRVLLAAGDTFRAAATEQLEVWGQRVGCEVVKGKEGGDPSAVIFDAVKRGRDQGYDVVLCDTAGRLQTKKELMEELRKIRRVIQKVDETAPHETLLVLDSTNGQNAIAQAQVFKEAMDITGIVLTKLDGTAKGGVILGICDELSVPVRFVGIGERVPDLREFDAGAFVDALYHTDEAA